MRQLLGFPPVDEPCLSESVDPDSSFFVVVNGRCDDHGGNNSFDDIEIGVGLRSGSADLPNQPVLFLESYAGVGVFDMVAFEFAAIRGVWPLTTRLVVSNSVEFVGSDVLSYRWDSLFCQDVEMLELR